MSSNVLSRFLPPPDSPSVYQTIQQHDVGSDSSDVEERAGMAHGEAHGEPFSDRELEYALADAGERQVSSPRAALLGDRRSQQATDRHGSPSVSRRRKPSRPRWMTQASPQGYELDDRDDDVPMSLLVEGEDDEVLKAHLPPPPHRMPSHSRSPSPQPPPHQNQPQWEAHRGRQPANPETVHPIRRWLNVQQPSLANIDPKKKAMWRWANVEDLDNFLKDVYTYFLGNGFWSILLSRSLNLLYVPAFRHLW